MDLVNAGSVRAIITAVRLLLFDPTTHSIEDERTFSAMNMIKSLIRSRLQEDHLNCTVRPYTMRRFFPATTFPFGAAYTRWNAKRKRRKQLK